jgi:hypothetical protein
MPNNPPTEHAEQRALMQWAAANSARHPELRLLFAVPNGGARSRATAGRLKAEGVKPGVPDLCLPVARGKYHSLWLELKRTKGGRVSPDQHWWHDQLTAQGHLVVTVKGCTEAVAALLPYLDQSPTKRSKPSKAATAPVPPPVPAPAIPASKARVIDYTRKPKLTWPSSKPSAAC